ncbi:MAG: Fe-S cluster assembly protein SufD [Chitinophagaceae bacterium]
MTSTIQHISDKYNELPNGNLKAFRQNAFESFNKLGIPTVKHEEWKYTRINTVFNHDLRIGALSQLSPKDLDAIRLPGKEQAIELYFINGIFQENISGKHESLTIMPLEDASNGEYAAIVKNNLGHSASYHPDGINALNTAMIHGGLFILSKKGKRIESPVYIYHINDNRAESTLALPRSLIYASAGSEIQIAEHHISLGDKETLTNQVTEIVAEQDATVNFYKIENEGPNSNLVSTIHFRQIGKALTNATTISLSGNIIRNNLNMVMEAEHGESHMYGLYLLDGKTHVDNHTIVDNVKPNCFSNELYKGVMDGESTGVFNGKIFVRVDAQKTNAYQSNKNVLLTENASVNTKPQLEIFADDVKCSHGCTIGKLDEEAMFYLRARGIGEKNAKSLLLHAFAIDILENIKVEPLRIFIDKLISERLEFNF